MVRLLFTDNWSDRPREQVLLLHSMKTTFCLSFEDFLYDRPVLLAISVSSLLFRISYILWSLTRRPSPIYWSLTLEFSHLMIADLRISHQMILISYLAKFHMLISYIFCSNDLSAGQRRGRRFFCVLCSKKRARELEEIRAGEKARKRKAQTRLPDSPKVISSRKLG